MAFTLVNTANANQAFVTRAKPTNLGTLAAANNAVQFQVSNLIAAPNGTDALTLVVTGNLAGGTFVLEGSIDGGATWFTVTVSAASANQNNSTAITGVTGVPDTAAVFAGTFNITGITGATLFRFGTTAFTSGSGAVWVLVP